MPSYTYFIGSMVAFAIWCLLFYHRRDLRKKMLIMSITLGIMSLILEAFVWTQDWWRPMTITGTLVGIEDIICNFSIAGIIAVIYEEVFKKKIAYRAHKPNTQQLVMFLLSGIITSNLLFFVYHIHSFYASIAGMLLPALCILFLRKDLVPVAFWTGIFGLLVGYLIAGTMYLIQPGYVHQWWLLTRLSGILVFGLPLEDALWFFVAGLLVGPLYEFWQGAVLVHK